MKQNQSNILKETLFQDMYFQRYLSSHKTVIAKNTLH